SLLVLDVNPRDGYRFESRQRCVDTVLTRFNCREHVNPFVVCNTAPYLSRRHSRQSNLHSREHSTRWISDYASNRCSGGLGPCTLSSEHNHYAGQADPTCTNHSHRFPSFRRNGVIVY